MERIDRQLSEFVLAQIEWQMEKISKAQHNLARRKALLRDQATRLRLGTPVTGMPIWTRDSSFGIGVRSPHGGSSC